MPTPSGELHWKAKLSAEDVELIRRLIEVRNHHFNEWRKLTSRQIAVKFNVSKSLIESIAAYRSRVTQQEPEAFAESRRIALEKGVSRYYTGNPCPKGHNGGRFTASANCCECAMELNRRKRARRKEQVA